MKKHLIITIILVIVVGVGAFFGGMQYQRMQRSTLFTSGGGAGQNGGRRFFGGTGGANSNMKPVRGQIISADSNSITVKMMDGSSTIVIVSGSTSISESAPAGKDALQTGKEVIVLGSQNSDGSVTAQTIQLNPQMGRDITPQPTK